MNFEALIQKILPYAPTVATALGGPLAGTVVSMIAAKLGVNPNDTDAIISNLTNSPDVKVQLKQLEDDFAKFKLQISVNDTENAREMKVNDDKLGKSSYMPVIITIFLMLTFVAVLIMLFIPSMTMNDSTIAGSMIGLLTREFIQACRFYIGGDANSS